MDTEQNKTVYSSDDTTHSDIEGDNMHREKFENRSNGLDTNEIRDGQNGRTIRPMGGQDMDSKNGVIRMGDMDNSAMEVTEEGAKNAAASIDQTKTSTVSVTTAGPDDYASDQVVGVPNAQKEAKKQDDNGNTDSSETAIPVSQEETEEDVANTGTSTDHQPTY